MSNIEDNSFNSSKESEVQNEQLKDGPFENRGQPVTHQVQDANSMSPDLAGHSSRSIYDANGSDSEDDKNKAKADDAHEHLFGEMSSSSDDNEAAPSKEKLEENSDSADDVAMARQRSNEPMESDDSGNAVRIKAPFSDDEQKSDSEEAEEMEEEPEPEPLNDDLPTKNVDLGGDLYHVKLPNFLTVVTNPFDPEYYQEENEDEEIIDEEGRTRLKLRCENAIRWRQIIDADGNQVAQSNTKFVRWSDGSLSLYIGAEMFDVTIMPVQDHSHLFLQQGNGLEGHAMFKEKMSFRPHSTDTLTHRKMVLSMAERQSARSQKTKMINVDDSEKDPEQQKKEMVRKEEERLRATVRRENQQRRIRERTGYNATLSTSYLEDMAGESDEEGDSIGRIKKQYGSIGSHRRNLDDDGYIPQHYGYESDQEQSQDKQPVRRIVSDDEDDSPQERNAQASSSQQIDDAASDVSQHAETSKSTKKVIDSDSD